MRLFGQAKRELLIYLKQGELEESAACKGSLQVQTEGNTSAKNI